MATRLINEDFIKNYRAKNARVLQDKRDNSPDFDLFVEDIKSALMCERNKAPNNIKLSRVLSNGEVAPCRLLTCDEMKQFFAGNVEKFAQLKTELAEIGVELNIEVRKHDWSPLLNRADTCGALRVGYSDGIPTCLKLQFEISRSVGLEPFSWELH